MDDYFDDSTKPRLRDELVDTRNDITHQNEQEENAMPLSRLYERVERLVEVIEINLLLDLGVPHNLTRELVKGAHVRQTKPVT